MARQMKDSGIEWIGDVPCHWNIVPLKRLAKIQTGNTPSKTEDNIYFSTENGYLWIKAENLGTMSSIETTTEYLTEEGIQVGRLFPENTVYVCCIASVGKVGFCTVPASCNQQINALIFHNAYWKYGFYLTVAQEAEYLLNASGNVMKIINSDKQSGLMCPFPPLEEQKRIAEFLDHQCAEIDAVIAKTKATIEEYKKLKQSVITEAVTKGIRPNRVLKDSGIEWIGDIPAHWNIRKGKWILKRLERPVEENDGVITCFRDGEVTLRSNRREEGFTFSLQEVGYQGIEPGDLVVHGMDGFAGAIGISDSRGKGTPVLNVLDSTEDKKYIMYYLRNMAYNGIFLALATGIRVRSCDTNWNKLKELPYLVPTIDEQKEIADYLDKKCAEMDTLIAKKTALLAEMETYKKSVIYEYVTGKKEVL